MFKPFFLNQEYSFDFKGNCQHNGETLIVEGDTVDVDIYGEKVSLNRYHAGLFTHYRINPLVVKMENVDFVEVKSKVLRLVCGALPVFKEPVEVGYGFRVIPGFSNFAVNSSGEVLSFRTGNILNVNINAYGYPCVAMYDPDKEAWRQVTTHLLVARAFVKNPDVEKNIYVNHKDAVKTNCHPDNLEWVTAQKNVIHAVEYGLNSQVEPCTMHDLLTGESWDYPSISSALRAHELKVRFAGWTRMVNGQSYPKVYNKRYIFTEQGCDLKNVTLDPESLIGKKSNSGPFQVLEIKSGIVVVCKTLKEASMTTGIPYDHVRALLNSTTPKTISGYAVRVMSEDPWPVDFDLLVTIPRRVFEIEHTVSGEKQTFESLRAVVRFFGVDKVTVKRRIRLGLELDGWLIRDKTES